MYFELLLLSQIFLLFDVLITINKFYGNYVKITIFEKKNVLNLLNKVLIYFLYLVLVLYIKVRLNYTYGYHYIKD